MAADWGATAAQFRGRAGSSSYLCPAGRTAGRVWGTNVYTDDSSVCTASVHMGLITIARGGEVTIRVVAGQTSYVGSTHNGITSSSYGGWSGSFSFLAAKQLPATTTATTVTARTTTKPGRRRRERARRSDSGGPGATSTAGWRSRAATRSGA